MSANTWAMPSAASQRPSAFTPGVSMRMAPPGSTTSSPAVVVWRPRPSASRIDWVRWTSAPARRLSKVDLPAPEAPSTTKVVPGTRSASHEVEALTADVADGEDVGADGDRLGVGDGRLGIGAEVDLGQHDRRDRAGLPGQHQLALEAALVDGPVGGVHDEDAVDVGRQHQLAGGPARVAPGDRRAAGQHTVDVVTDRVDTDPVAHGHGVAGAGMEGARRGEHQGPATIGSGDAPEDQPGR